MHGRSIFSVACFLLHWNSCVLPILTFQAEKRFHGIVWICLVVLLFVFYGPATGP